jgi:hypothetical protein
VRLRPALTRLLVLLLLMQWGTAFGHCLRLAAPGDDFVVEICTAEGIHRVALADTGDQTDDDQDAPPMLAGLCPACAGPAAVALPAPPVTLAAPVILAQAVDPPAPPPQPTSPLPPRSCQPRAPPTS